MAEIAIEPETQPNAALREIALLSAVLAMAMSAMDLVHWKWAELYHTVPSPLAGEGQGGGYHRH